jgi:hypothetical protein
MATDRAKKNWMPAGYRANLRLQRAWLTRHCHFVRYPAWS